MARRRYQKGNLRKRGKRCPVWELQWWEDYIKENGSIGRRRQSAVLGLVSDLTQRQARKLAEDRLRPDQPGVVAAAIHAGVRRFRRALLRAPFLSNTQTFHAKTLPSNSNNSPLACFWKLSASGHRNRRPAAICIAKNGRRFGMGIRQSFAQSRLQGLRTGDAMELPLGAQSRKWSFASRENSGSRKTRSHTRTDSSSSRIAQGASSHHRALRHFDGDAGRGNSRSAPTRTWTLSRARSVSNRPIIAACSDRRRPKAASDHFPFPEHSSLRSRAYVDTTRDPKTSAWYFNPAHGKPLSDSNLLHRHLKPAGAKIGAPWLNWHTLRRTHATLLQVAGASLKGCASATRSQQDVHDARDLHGADSRASCG